MQGRTPDEREVQMITLVAKKGVMPVVALGVLL